MVVNIIVFTINEFAKNHINGIEWSFTERCLAPFNKISNGLNDKNFLLFVRISME